jgi:hypothetical protein
MLWFLGSRFLSLGSFKGENLRGQKKTSKVVI